jgi:hypothetical protein
MILHGNARGGGRELAVHLMRTDENEHVQVHDVSGFMSDDVRGHFCPRRFWVSTVTERTRRR